MRNRGAPPPGGEHRAAWDNAREPPGRSAGDPPAERSEDRLAQLAASVGPLRRVLAAIAARLIATRAHERLCYARLGDYARERPGVSARQLQDLARVHHSLARLPELERALLGNTLPWSKVRLLARVATPADEDLWIARARDVPTRRLEQDVRACVGDDAPDVLDDAPPEAMVSVRCTPAVREKWGLVRELAERVAGQRLRSGEALELVAAEICSGIPIDRGLPSACDDPRAPCRDEIRTAERAGACAARARPRELPPAVALLAAGLEDADPFELDRRLRRAVALEQTLDAAIAPLLRAVTSAWHEWSGDYQTLSSYAREQLGMSAGKARALLRLERAGDLCPELRAAYRSGRLSWVKAQCLLPLFLLEIDGDWRPAWVAWAARVTVRRLAADVERALLLRAAHHLAWHRCKFDPEKAQDPIPAGERQLCAHDVDPDATQQLEWHVPQEVAWLFRAVLETVRARLRTATAAATDTGSTAATPVTALRLPLDGEVFDALLDGALLAWTLRDPKARRPDPVMERDGYRCLIPGCSSRRNLHDHHVAFRSAGGSDAPENRIALCAFHHLRCLHAGFLRVSGQAPHELVFELGLRAGAAPLTCYRSGDVSVHATQIATISRAPARRGRVQPTGLAW